jgi:hypothetical protein
LIALAVLVVGRGVESALHRIKGDSDPGDAGNRERGTGKSTFR